MLAGLKQGQVQLLKRNFSGTISVSSNDMDIYSWTVDEILQNLFALDNPTDLSTANRLERLRALRSMSTLTPAQVRELEQLRQSVSIDTLRGPSSDTIRRFAEELQVARDQHKSNPSPK